MIKVLIVYHADCLDGLVSARVAKRRFPDADLLAARYGSPLPPLDERDTDVVIVDFSYPIEDLKLLSRGRHVSVYDHHATTRDEFVAAMVRPPPNPDRFVHEIAWGDSEGGCLTFHFDIDKSGAGLTWDELFPGEERPWLVDYAEDRDLWRFEKPYSRSVNQAIGACRSLDELDELMALGLNHAIRSGDMLLRAQRNRLSAYLERATQAQLLAGRRSHPCVAVNATSDVSDIGNALFQHRANPGEFVVVWQYLGDKYKYSLRSGDGGPDVGEIAKAAGGGGHRNAASFSNPHFVLVDADKPVRADASE